MDDLASHQISRTEPRVQVGLGREDEDQRHQREWREPDGAPTGQRHFHTVESNRVLVITSKSPYAVRALAELARRGGTTPVPIAEIAKAQDIPVQFLEGLFASLRRAGLLQSQRGINVGYYFARPPGEINLLEVIELLEG